MRKLLKFGLAGVFMLFATFMATMALPPPDVAIADDDSQLHSYQLESPAISYQYADESFLGSRICSYSMAITTTCEATSTSYSNLALRIDGSKSNLDWYNLKLCDAESDKQAWLTNTTDKWYNQLTIYSSKPIRTYSNKTRLITSMENTPKDLARYRQALTS